MPLKLTILIESIDINFLFCTTEPIIFILNAKEPIIFILNAKEPIVLNPIHFKCKRANHIKF